jgi:hypothetical protein
MTVNLFTAAGYFLFSGIGGFGDWAVFIQGFSPQWAWRTGMAIFGAATYTLAAWFSLLELRPLIGSDSRGASNQGPLLCGRNSGLHGRRSEPAGLDSRRALGGIDVWRYVRIPLDDRLAPWRLDSFGFGAGTGADPKSWPWIATACVLAPGSIFVPGPGVRLARTP